MKTGPKILFYLQTTTEFKSLFPIVKALKAENLDVMIGFTTVNSFTEEQEITNREGIKSLSIKVLEPPLDYIFPNKDSYYTIQGGWILRKLKAGINKGIALKFLIKKLLFSNSLFLTTLYLNTRLNKKNKLIFSRLLCQHKFDVVIMAEDSFYFGRGSAILAAKKYGAKTLIFPFTISYERAPYLFICGIEHLLNSLQVKGFLKHILFFCFPTWVSKLEATKVFRWYIGEMVAAYVSGIMPAYPWKYNYGMADYILVESEYMKQHCLRNFIPENKIINTGAVYYDTLSKEAPLNNTKNKERTIVLALIPDYKPNKYFKDVKSVWTYFVTSIKKYLPDYMLTISLHPRTSLTEAEFLENYGCRIAYGIPVQQLIRNSDLFVTSISASIRFALFFNVPVINFDIYGYYYDDYDNLSPVKTMYTTESYESLLNEISSNDQFLPNWKNEYQSYRNYFGSSDGKNTQRIVDFLQTLKRNAS